MAEEPDVRWVGRVGGYSLEMHGSSAAGALRFILDGPELAWPVSFPVQGDNLETLKEAMEQGFDAAMGGKSAPVRLARA